MTTTAITLTDFLLARITEDEAEAQTEGIREPTTCEPVVLDFDGTVAMIVSPARVLAECEAKRRIVERAHRASSAFNQSINPTTSGVAMTMDLVLAALALPYADHPDYREEWKL